MKRRTFFATLLSPLLARCAPAPQMFAWKSAGAWVHSGEIDRATFKFWQRELQTRATRLNADVFRNVYEKCR